MNPNIPFVHRSRQDLSGYWPGQLRLNPQLDVKAPEVIEKEFFVPLPWNLQVEHLKWPAPDQELSGIVTPVQNQNFRDWNRKFAEGTIVYHNSIRCRKESGRRVFLVFEGSNYRTEARLNGQAIGTHEGGHLAFEFEVTAALRDGLNKFEITVDNLRRKDACPQEQFNWQNYGGIYRRLYLESRPAHFIRMHRLTPVRDGKGWHVDVELEMDVAMRGKIEVEIRSGDCRETLSSKLDGTRWKQRMTLRGSPRVWQPGTGGLSDYRIRFEGDGDVRDEIEGAFGLRTVAVNGHAICINGEKIRILGAAWHEQHPAFGNAVPGWQSMRDIQLMKHVGMNAIRTSHYPHAQDLYDACDRTGMLCVAELPCWQFNEHHFSNPKMRDFCVDYARQMVAQLGNHPSIIGWMIQNESKTFAEGATDFFGAISRAFKEADPSRLTLVADSPHPPEHLAVGQVSGPLGPPAPTHALVDVFGINNYSGWYSDKAEHLPALLDHVHKHLPDKAIMVTEFGAEGILGQRALTLAPWTEDYQAELLARHMTEILKRDCVAGFFLWLFIDYECASIGIRALNAKGLVDEYRRPKLSFNVVKNLLETWRRQ
jgi:beta-glucuronidase